MDTQNNSLVISHTSALELLRRHGAAGLDRGPRRPGPPAHAHASLDLLNRAETACPAVRGLGRPLHVSVGQKSSMFRSGDFAFHSIPDATPSNSYLHLGPDVYVAGPELCLCQVSSAFDPIDLALLLMELCGTYRLVDGALYGDVPALTSPVAIERFLQKWLDKAARRPRGVERLQRVLPYVAAGSASPRETALCLTLCLPHQYGGYGLPLPELNHTLDLGKGSGLDSAGRRAVRFDLCWPEARLALEYDSDAYHLDPRRHALDAEKRALSLGHGFTVVSVTNGQLRNPKATHELARLVARRLGKRLRPRDARFDERRAELHRRLVLGKKTGER